MQATDRTLTGSPRPDSFEFLDQIGTVIGARCRYDPEHPVFAGHYPGQPIVPGNFLLGIGADLVSQHPAGSEVTGLRKVRFAEPLWPGDVFEVHVDQGTRTDPLAFSCQVMRDGHRCASFVAQTTPPPPPPPRPELGAVTDTYPEEITSLLPHRDPILLVDHLLQVGNRMVAEKEIRPDELLCYGEPIYPLALLLESAAQGAIAGFIAGARDGRPAPNQGFLFMGLQSVDLLDRVPLGAVLRHELTGVRDLGDVLVLDLISWVEGAPVLVATGVTAAVRPFAEFRRSDHE